MYAYRNLNAHMCTQILCVLITGNNSTKVMKAFTEILLYDKDELNLSKY